MATIDAQAVLEMLSHVDDLTLSAIIATLLQNKPELAPSLVTVACPDLTYAPSKALTERRCSGVIKKVNNQMGYGFIACPELGAVFGCDVFVHRKQLGVFTEGTEVNFAVTLNRDNKPQAFDLLTNTGQSTAGLASPSPPQAPATSATPNFNMGAMAAYGMTGVSAMPAMPALGGMDMSAMAGMDFNAFGDMSALTGSDGGVPGMAMAPQASTGKGGMLVQAAPQLQQQQQQQQQQQFGGKKGGGKGSQTVLGEYYGVIKSYNTEKGFGFIVCDGLKGQAEGDVYLHAKHVGDFQVGAEVKFQAYLHNGRLQGRDLQDATGMVGPQSSGNYNPPPRQQFGGQPQPQQFGGQPQHQFNAQPPQQNFGGGQSGGQFGGGPGGGPETDLGVFVGRIKNFNQEKGYGFISCDELNAQGYTGDVFVHNRNIGSFQVGDDVAFTAVLRNGRLQGRDLQDPLGGPAKRLRTN